MEECKDCTTCNRAVFDEKWGEYKCLKRQIHIYNVDERDGCKDWQKKRKKTNKN